VGRAASRRRDVVCARGRAGGCQPCARGFGDRRDDASGYRLGCGRGELRIRDRLLRRPSQRDRHLVSLLAVHRGVERVEQRTDEREHGQHRRRLCIRHREEPQRPQRFGKQRRRHRQQPDDSRHPHESGRTDDRRRGARPHELVRRVRDRGVRQLRVRRLTGMRPHTRTAVPEPLRGQRSGRDRNRRPRSAEDSRQAAQWRSTGVGPCHRGRDLGPLRLPHRRLPGPPDSGRHRQPRRTETRYLAA
jgi:hypothetical protein